MINRLIVVWEWLFSIKLWWAHVTETPDDNKIIVFNRGIWNGLKGVMPIGGQVIPNSILGDRLLWKKLQKKEIKKKISETINKIIPHFKPLITQIVCNPWKVPSREISRHHWYIFNNVIINPKINKFILYWWNHFTNPDTRVKVLTALVKGHGLKFTKWNGWFQWFDIYVTSLEYNLLKTVKT